MFLCKPLKARNHRTELETVKLMSLRSSGLPNWSSDIQRIASELGNKSKFVIFELLSLFSLLTHRHLVGLITYSSDSQPIR